MEPSIEKKKRGRKSKIDIQASASETSLNEIETKENNIVLEKIPKKRGRKPKGGKVVSSIDNIKPDIVSVQNIILHLKCNKSELTNNEIFHEVDTYQFNNNKSYDFNYLQISNMKQESSNINNINNTNNTNNTNNINNTNNTITTTENTDNKIVWQKLEKLSSLLHLDNICDKKSSCFFCTCDFDNMPIYIPKFQLNKMFHVYGCFCSPECACAYLMNDKNIDTTSRFERYYLLNYIYSKIYNYEKNIKPAPCPYYLLDKYYGNLSIQEYRKLLKSERLLLVVDKPLVRSMPELHDDSDDYLLNNKGIPAAINKYVPQKEDNIVCKNDIVNQKFNIK